MGTAQTKANNKYKAKAYDRIEIIVPKGKKAIIAEAAKAQGKSVNGFITEAIDKKMSREQ